MRGTGKGAMAIVSNPYRAGCARSGIGAEVPSPGTDAQAFPALLSLYPAGWGGSDRSRGAGR